MAFMRRVSGTMTMLLGRLFINSQTGINRITNIHESKYAGNHNNIVYISQDYNKIHFAV